MMFTHVTKGNNVHGQMCVRVSLVSEHKEKDLALTKQMSLTNLNKLTHRSLLLTSSLYFAVTLNNPEVTDIN